ncbi:hypothetical protein WN943_011023 [Citrus x changshan-huyou]
MRSDNETEFTCLDDYFVEKGVIHQISCVGTPQQNGRVERKHRHILNIARALHFQANLPIEFWGECILTAAYLINRTLFELHGGDKLASRSRKCIFVGCPYGKKDWSLYDLNSGELFVLRDVLFKEHVFPYVNKCTSEQSKTKNNEVDGLVAEEEMMWGADVSENLEHHSRIPHQEEYGIRDDERETSPRQEDQEGIRDIDYGKSAETPIYDE